MQWCWVAARGPVPGARSHSSVLRRSTNAIAAIGWASGFMLVPFHDCFGHHQVLPRHSNALEDDGAVCAKRSPASDNIHHRDQIVGAKMALAHRQDDVPSFSQCRAHVFDDDIGTAHQVTV